MLMCLSVPGRVVSVSGKTAIADFYGKKNKLNTELVRVKKGDYILAYNGYAMEKVTEKEALKILSKLKGK